MATLGTIDARFLRMAYEEALAGFNEGGCPIGSVLARANVSSPAGAISASSRATPSPTARWTACARPAARGPTGT